MLHFVNIVVKRDSAYFNSLDAVVKNISELFTRFLGSQFMLAYVIKQTHAWLSRLYYIYICDSSDKLEQKSLL